MSFTYTYDKIEKEDKTCYFQRTRTDTATGKVTTRKIDSTYNGLIIAHPNPEAMEVIHHDFGTLEITRYYEVMISDSIVTKCQLSDGRIYDADNVIITHMIEHGKTMPTLETYTPEPLENILQSKIDEIDSVTKELIAGGFDHDASSFSMSDAAQRNWAGLAAAHALGLISFPYTISTVDEGQYVVSDSAAMIAFLGSYLSYQSDPTKPLGLGRQYKAQLRAIYDDTGLTEGEKCTQIESWVDPR